MNPTNPTNVLTGVQTVIYPDDTLSHQNFKEAIQIRWPKAQGSAFHLCVGTDAGKWDILSGDVGERRQQLFDLSDVPASVQAIYVQLIMIADDGTVGEIIEIKRRGASIVQGTSYV
jgi:hypothetical protein